LGTLYYLYYIVSTLEIFSEEQMRITNLFTVLSLCLLTTDK